jgi:hypothetical protein
MLLATCSASAAVVATPPLGTPMPYWTLVSHRCLGCFVYRGMPAYRFEQRGGPVLVDGQTSPLLDGGALHGVLLRRVSLYPKCVATSVRGFLTWRRWSGTYGSSESVGQRPGAGKVVHCI